VRFRFAALALPALQLAALPTIRSLNFDGYSGIKAMFGPTFNPDTQAVFNAANGGTLTSTVVRTLLP